MSAFSEYSAETIRHMIKVQSVKLSRCVGNVDREVLQSDIEEMVGELHSRGESYETKE